MINRIKGYFGGGDSPDYKPGHNRLEGYFNRLDEARSQDPHADQVQHGTKEEIHDCLQRSPLANDIASRPAKTKLPSYIEEKLARKKDLLGDKARKMSPQEMGVDISNQT